MYQMSQSYTCTNCGEGGNWSGNASRGISYSPLESVVSSSAVSYESRSSVGGNGYFVVPSASNSSLSSKLSPEYSFSFNSSSNSGLSYSSSSSSPVSYKSSSLGYGLFQSQQNYNFIPDNFLKQGNLGMFVGKADEIKEFVEEAFELMFHEAFPKDIKVSVLNEEKFHKLAPHPGTIGLSINRRKNGLLSEIFVKNDFLGRVLLTFGHELGHVLTQTLDHAQDEEAKAYAFSLAWMRIIKEHNIAGLKEAIVTERPAENGLHNVAFNFVETLQQQGKGWWEIYQELVGREVSIAS